MAKTTGPDFIENTKYIHMDRSDQEKGLPQPPLEKPLENGGTILALPAPTIIDTPLRKVIESRSSLRKYTEKPLSLEELSYLLWCCQGVKQRSNTRTYRTVPSAGARHALDTYIWANRVTGLETGLYRYLALDHRLQIFIPGDKIGYQLAEASLDQEFLSKSAALFIWVAVVERMTYRYAERGYRYLYLDAGHACQNLYLASESIGCGACAVAAFDDDQLNQLFCVDGVNEFVIYMAPVGKRK